MFLEWFSKLNMDTLTAEYRTHSYGSTLCEETTRTLFGRTTQRWISLHQDLYQLQQRGGERRRMLRRSRVKKEEDKQRKKRRFGSRIRRKGKRKTREEDREENVKMNEEGREKQ